MDSWVRGRYPTETEEGLGPAQAAVARDVVVKKSPPRSPLKQTLVPCFLFKASILPAPMVRAIRSKHRACGRCVGTPIGTYLGSLLLTHRAQVARYPRQLRQER